MGLHMEASTLGIVPEVMFGSALSVTRAIAPEIFWEFHILVQRVQGWSLVGLPLLEQRMEQELCLLLEVASCRFRQIVPEHLMGAPMVGPTAHIPRRLLVCLFLKYPLLLTLTSIILLPRTVGPLQVLVHMHSPALYPTGLQVSWRMARCPHIPTQPLPEACHSPKDSHLLASPIQ